MATIISDVQLSYEIMRYDGGFMSPREIAEKILHHHMDCVPEGEAVVIEPDDPQYDAYCVSHEEGLQIRDFVTEDWISIEV